jgi:hypothetical protein
MAQYGLESRVLHGFSCRALKCHVRCLIPAHTTCASVIADQGVEAAHTAVGGEAKAQNLGGLFGIGNGDPNVCQEIPPMKMSAAKTRSLGGCVTCPLLIDWSKFINRYDRQYGKVSVTLYSASLVLLNVAPRLQYCFMRGINYVVENPVSSLLWRYRCVREPYPEFGTFISVS